MVDDIALCWRIRSEPQWNTDDGNIGMRLSVETEGSKHRELILEYPFEEKQKGHSRFPDRPKIDPQALARDIRSAMEAGWNPKSRGRPFVFALGD